MSVLNPTKPPKIKPVVTAVGKPPKLGRLAALKKAKAAHSKPLLFEAMDNATAYTYPIIGGQLGLYDGRLALTREAHVGQTKWINRLSIRLKGVE